jgi:hypothetical protein
MFLVALAHAAPIEVGERLEWKVEWMGMQAGTAWAELRADGEGYRIEAGCDTSGMAERLYPVHDRLTSRWSPEEGSRSYVTRFREGGFQQDQWMNFAESGFSVRRTQLYKDGWKTKEDHYAGSSDVEDPVSAFYRLRTVELLPGITASFPLFTGRRTVSLVATGTEQTSLSGQSALKVEVSTEHQGDIQGRLVVFMSTDGDRLPLQVVVQTKAGPVYATLSRRAVLP